MTLALIAAHAAGILAKSGGISLDPIAKPLASILAFFYAVVPNYGATILLLTTVMMIVLTPLTIKQTRSMLVMQKLQPELKRLQELHKNDRQALNEAVMAMYKEHNASPLGGCLPMLLPLPVFFALFRVLEGLSRKVGGISKPKYLSANTRMFKDIVHANSKLDFFGMDLAKSASNVAGTFWHKLPYFILLLLMVGTQYYQQRQLTSKNPQAAQGSQQAIMKFIPIFFGVISIRFPAGLVIYWTWSNAIRIFQQWAMYRYDPKVKALVTKDVREVEAKTKEIDERKDAKPPAGRPRLRDLLTGAAEASGSRSLQPKNGGPKGGGTRNPSAKSGGPAGKSGASKNPPPKPKNGNGASPAKPAGSSGAGTPGPGTGNGSKGRTGAGGARTGGAPSGGATSRRRRSRRSR